MRKLSKKTIALLAAAAVLFAGGGAAGTRAVLNIYSPDYYIDFATDDQDVAVVENSAVVSGSNSMLGDLSGKVIPGKTYTEEIAAKNTSGSDQYVRLVIRKYWVLPGEDASNKSYAARNLDPGMIKLELANGSGWTRNSSESTDEREVYYYSSIVPSGGVTNAVTTTLSVDGEVLKETSTTTKDNVITFSYLYDGYQIAIEAEAQSIQTHNADEAIKSIWGVQNVSVSGSTLLVSNN